MVVFHCLIAAFHCVELAVERWRDPAKLVVLYEKIDRFMHHVWFSSHDWGKMLGKYSEYYYTVTGLMHADHFWTHCSEFDITESTGCSSDYIVVRTGGLASTWVLPCCLKGNLALLISWLSKQRNGFMGNKTLSFQDKILAFLCVQNNKISVETIPLTLTGPVCVRREPLGSAQFWYLFTEVRIYLSRWIKGRYAPPPSSARYSAEAL
jgi:hypothetical protein